MHTSSDQFGQVTDSTDQLLSSSSTSLPSHSFRTKRGFAAFIPALASLTTISVESIGSFLQKKCNAALSKGLNAIKSDLSLAWNSIKQLETEDPATAEAPVKKGMGIAAAPGNYQPATPRYVRANEDSEDGQDTDEEGDRHHS